VNSIQNKKEQKLILFACVILILYLSPLYILGEHAHIRVHDNLDSNIAWYKVLASSGEIRGSINATIPQVINGQLSRNAFSTEFSLIVWLYTLFPTMIAYALSQSISRFVAFIGMYLLLFFKIKFCLSFLVEKLRKFFLCYPLICFSIYSPIFHK
jgi:Protein of unknown function (DUF6044)